MMKVGVSRNYLYYEYVVLYQSARMRVTEARGHERTGGRTLIHG